eukprot:scaffold5542_cov134-Pinguiococcus_pyrenoidosus.AAC.1
MRKRRRDAQVLEEESAALGWSKATLLPPSESDGDLAEAELMRSQHVRRASRWDMEMTTPALSSLADIAHPFGRRQELRNRTRSKLEETMEAPLFAGADSSTVDRRKQARRLRRSVRVAPAGEGQADDAAGVRTRFRIGKKSAPSKGADALQEREMSSMDDQNESGGAQIRAL